MSWVVGFSFLTVSVSYYHNFPEKTRPAEAERLVPVSLYAFFTLLDEGNLA
jgi:hypothetical protein